MQRIPEPELMDSQAQTRAYAEADFSDSNSLFVSNFVQRFPDLPKNGDLIDLGCGPADICIRLSNALNGWQVTGLDAGENMLKCAGAAIAQAGRCDHIKLRQSYLPDDSLGFRNFDAIISNSLLHHLPEAMTLWETIVKIGRPGAAITVMDLRRPESVSSASALVEQYSADEPDVLKEDFYNSLLAAYSSDEIAMQMQKAGLDYLEFEIPSDRHWIVSGRLAS
jgi:ubiquinone/menaquinone biosynthesis C-methylase UbiE